MTDFTPLATSVTGSLSLADSPEAATALAGFNTAVTHRPDAVLVAASVDDVVAGVTFARDNGIPVRAFNTGHGAVTPVQGGLIISVRDLDSLSLDASARTVTVGGGMTWAPIVAAAGEHGLAPITGSSATVGVLGYLTGGGLGPLANSHGFSSDYLQSATVVTGTGEVVVASADADSDLLWALRGGKGGLGIVVEATLRLVELETLYGGSLFFDGADAQHVLTEWITWRETADDRITSSVLVARFPDLEMMPPPLRGRHVVAMHFAYPGPASEGEKLAAPLREWGTVVMDDLGELAASQIARVHNDPTDPGPGWGFGISLKDIDADFVAALLQTFGGEAHLPLIGCELRLPGGAIRSDVPEGSSAGWRDITALAHVLGAPDPSLFETVLPGLEKQIVASLTPWISDHSTVNWIEHPTDPTEYASAWPAETRTRLEAIRAAHDPDRVFPYGPA
ncbi:FAD-binding oxidoreductase [soil metagenome]